MAGNHQCGSISERPHSEIFPWLRQGSQFQHIEIGMFQGIEPLPFFIGDVFGDHIP